MLARRVIIALTLNDGVLFRTKQFTPDYRYTLNFVDLELADEILLIDVTRPQFGKRENFWKTVDRFSEELFLPTTIGGKFKEIEEIDEAFRVHGADKILINTLGYESPEIIDQLAHKYGSQSVVVGIDVKDDHVYIRQGRVDTGQRAYNWAGEVQDRGAGEIVLMDMKRDGSLQGYNLDLINYVSIPLNIPVVAIGGCGCWQHMVDGFEAGANACATTVIHHFTAASLKAAKTYLKEKGLPVRL